jgi:hypothetical protein
VNPLLQRCEGTVVELAPILDYASPRKRVKLRLPTRSRIRCDLESNQLTIIETLEGRGGAIGAIIYAIFMLIYLGYVTVTVRGAGLVGIFWLIEATLLVMVIHQTWRKTMLTVTDTVVCLKFTSPIMRKMYQWPAVQVRDVLAVVTANTNSGNPLAELRISLESGQELHLFSDHRAGEIDDLVVGIREALRR